MSGQQKQWLQYQVVTHKGVIHVLVGNFLHVGIEGQQPSHPSLSPAFCNVQINPVSEALLVAAGGGEVVWIMNVLQKKEMG